MSSSNRKLLPARNVWKKLATALRSKFLLLKRSNAFKRTATGLTAAASAILGGRRRPPPRFRLKGRKQKLHRRRRRRRQYRQHSFAHVYVDEVFNRPTTPERIVAAPLPVSKLVVDIAASGGPALGSEKGSSAADLPVEVGRVVVNPVQSAQCNTGKATAEPPDPAGIDQLEGVDLKAELFIAKFREEMRLQRQRSFDEYREMLARGL